MTLNFRNFGSSKFFGKSCANVPPSIPCGTQRPLRDPIRNISSTEAKSGQDKPPSCGAAKSSGCGSSQPTSCPVPKPSGCGSLKPPDCGPKRESDCPKTQKSSGCGPAKTTECGKNKPSACPSKPSGCGQAKMIGNLSWASLMKISSGAEPLVVG